MLRMSQPRRFRRHLHCLHLLAGLGQSQGQALPPAQYSVQDLMEAPNNSINFRTGQSTTQGRSMRTTRDPDLDILSTYRYDTECGRS